ncbi:MULTISPECIES: hypothetical protein [unclassified Francisella]|uniref:hypothetical protein n=1 Tax=unclassified Francisella TaxID=2610885 RepID=UPI002E30F865|nr:MULTISPECIES: hypothetical protein [unclassified Francisella]MED7819398.1 hypothetical protein [Francisella sp. 19S2-4]MED7830145.1 hypothetical protein [Francisella sp. 19S2-10]
MKNLNQQTFRRIQAHILKELDNYIKNRFTNFFTDNQHQRAVSARYYINRASNLETIRYIINNELSLLEIGQPISEYLDEAIEYNVSLYAKEISNMNKGGYFATLKECKYYLSRLTIITPDRLVAQSILKEVDYRSLALTHNDPNKMIMEGRMAEFSKTIHGNSFILSDSSIFENLQDDSQHYPPFKENFTYIFTIFCHRTSIDHLEMRISVGDSRVHSTLVHNGEFNKDDYTLSNINEFFVVMAGEIILNNDEIRITNKSGHFRPPLKYFNACKEFIKEKLKWYEYQGYKIIFRDLEESYWTK